MKIRLSLTLRIDRGDPVATDRPDGFAGDITTEAHYAGPTELAMGFTGPGGWEDDE